jgi:hypothetical protein
LKRVRQIFKGFSYQALFTAKPARRKKPRPQFLKLGRAEEDIIVVFTLAETDTFAIYILKAGDNLNFWWRNSKAGLSEGLRPRHTFTGHREWQIKPRLMRGVNVTQEVSTSPSSGDVTEIW